MSIYFDKKIYKSDYLFFIILILTCIINANSHEKMIVKTIVLCIVSVYFMGRYVLLKCNKFIIKVDCLFVLWLIAYSIIVFLYAYFFSWISPFGPLVNLVVTIVSCVNIILLFSYIPAEDVFNFTMISFSVALGGYICLLVMSFLSMDVSNLYMAYRLGSSLDDTDKGIDNPNSIALNIIFLMMPFSYKLLYYNRNIYFIPFFVCTLLVLLTGSKKGLVGIVAYVISFKLFRGKISDIIYILLVIASLTVVVFQNEFLYDVIGHRLEGMLVVMGVMDSSVISDTAMSDQMRGQMFFLGLDMWARHPIFGNGLGYFEINSPMRLYSHNNFIEILVTYGLNGLIIYYSLFIAMLVKIMNRIKTNIIEVKIVVIYMLFMTMFDFSSIRYDSTFNIILLLILSYFINNVRKTKMATDTKSTISAITARYD